jgi:hypothetical protein
MRVELTQYDLFLDLYLSRRGQEMTIADWRAGVAQIPGFWSDADREAMLREGEEDRLRKLLKRMPKYDEEGHNIERIAVKRKDRHTGRQQDLWLEPSHMTYEDKVRTIEACLKRREYFDAEARRLCRVLLQASSPKERHKLERRFQALLELDFGPVEAPAEDA